MPWDPESFKEKHNQSLSKEEAEQASKVANAILEETGDEGKAIRIANAQVAGTIHHPGGRYKSFRRASD